MMSAVYTANPMKQLFHYSKLADLLAVAVALPLAGCGKKEEATQPPVRPSQPTPPPPVVLQEEKNPTETGYNLPVSRRFV